MDFDDLEAFRDVAQFGGFAAAASGRGIAQSSLSRRVAQLEAQLKTKLMERTTKGVDLTEAGQLLLQRADLLLSKVGALKTDLASRGDRVHGVVRLGMSPSSTRISFMPLADHIRETAPDVEVILMERLSEELIQSLMREEIDLAVVLQPPVLANLDVIEVAEEGFWLIGHKTQIEHLTGTLDVISLCDKLPLIQQARANPLRRLIEVEAAKRQLTPNVIAEVQSYPTLVSYIENGVACNFCTDSIAAPILMNKDIIGIRVPGLRIRKLIARKRGRPQSLAERTVSEALAMILRR